MASLQDFLGRPDDNGNLRDAIIEVYREFNASLPTELLPEKIQKSIDNLK